MTIARLSTFVGDASASRRRTFFLGVCGLFFYFLIGLVPLGIFPPPLFTYTLSTISFVLLVGLMGWTLVRKPSSAKQEREQHGMPHIPQKDFTAPAKPFSEVVTALIQSAPRS